MTDFLRARQQLIVPLALLFLSLAVLSRQSYVETRPRPSLFARALVTTVGLPQRAVAYPIRGVTRVWRNYFYLVGLRQKNLELQKEVALLEEALLQAEEYRLENERLRRLVEFAEQVSFRLVPARVIGEDVLAESKTLTINKGSRDGIRPGMVAVAAGGVVGQLLDEPGSTIGLNAAQVLLITDRNSRVDALIQRSRARGVVRGRGGVGRLELLYVERTADVAEGDAVVCSGLGGIFPKGLLLGTVAAVESDPNQLSLRVEVTAGADFSRLEEVLIVFPETAP